MDLELGYYNSYAISVLSIGMAQFIHNGGVLRIVTNRVLSEMDTALIFEEEAGKYRDGLRDLVKNDSRLKELEEVLAKREQHFYDCLLYLKDNNRLIIVPVQPKQSKSGLAHSKICVVSDGENQLYFSGSTNFTGAALLKNTESIDIFPDWKGDVITNKAKIYSFETRFNQLIGKQHSDYIFLIESEIEKAIYNKGVEKSLNELLEEESLIKLASEEELHPSFKKIYQKKREEFENKVTRILKEPKFPYLSGPREYQINAYENWVRNNYSGVFAMATGTGKTITSLNCLLIEYEKTGSYKSIILVPSLALLDQWENEVITFNFKNIIKVGSGNKWEPKMANLISNKTWGIEQDFVIVSTYGSFVTDRFQKYFKQIQKELILIADEAHNMGAANIKKRLSEIEIDKKIGLSATPKRVYDIEGTDALNDFFNDRPPYTYVFGMDKALDQGFLSEYIYKPILVELDEIELEEYISISKKLLQFFDFEKKEFKSNPIVEILLLKRKNIIHRASNKLLHFKEILQELKKNNKLHFAFAYVPEGYTISDDGETVKLLNQFIKAGKEAIPELKMNSYTSKDEDLKSIIRGFTEGKIDLLFAMKMLDEGVDIPRAEIGIFCSSTGNPRQFIQRRGRLLRKHQDKSFATIYDMVVIPKLSGINQDFFNMEKNLVKTELRRVAYFSSLAMNFYDSKSTLETVCSKYGLNLDKIINEL